jgi:hypothetical protein
MFRVLLVSAICSRVRLHLTATNTSYSTSTTQLPTRAAQLSSAFAALSACHGNLIDACRALYAPIPMPAEDIPPLSLDENDQSDSLRGRREVVTQLRRWISTVEKVHVALLAVGNISSSNPVPDLIRRKTLPNGAAAYYQYFQQFTEMQDPVEKPHILETTINAAVNYYPRLEIALQRYLPGTLSNPVAKESSHTGHAHGPGEQCTEEEEETEVSGNELDRVFSFMGTTLGELSEIYLRFISGDAKTHPHLMQLLTSYTIAVEESYILLSWESPEAGSLAQLQDCFQVFKQNITPVLAGLSRFPLERSLGHLPPISPSTLRSQLENIVNFHNQWGELVDALVPASQPCVSTA